MNQEQIEKLVQAYDTLRRVQRRLDTATRLINQLELRSSLELDDCATNDILPDQYHEVSLVLGCFCAEVPAKELCTALLPWAKEWKARIEKELEALEMPK